MFRRKSPRKIFRSARRGGQFRPLRSVTLVVAVLGGAFFGLASLAKPAAQLAEDTVLAAGVNPAALAWAHLGGTDVGVNDLTVGMTFEQFRALSGGNLSVKAAKWGVIGVLRTDKGVFSVYFPDTRPLAEAYRVRFDRTAEKLSGRDAADRLSALWGRPSVRDCSRGIADLDCRFEWRATDGLRRTARVLTDDGRTTVHLNTVSSGGKYVRPGLRLAELGEASSLR